MQERGKTRVSTGWVAKGKVDAAARDRYVAGEIRRMKRLRTRGHRDWVGVSDEKIEELGRALGRIYAENFRKPARPR